LSYPIMMVGAGLPKIYSMLSAEKSYSERLFSYQEIGSLKREQAVKAIQIPAEKLNRSYEEKAIQKIIDVTKGYPFFIQQFCQIVYQNSDGQEITLGDVEKNAEEFFKVLD